ncbi:SAM-dependent methyltransferase [Xenorhabdus budapestensis]|uniref:SAM-dependent methyltransferase n=1 Tax=Xenorhabdus budapestensis TaxID=290110 RepID=A0A2D0IW56_XENBU|nr:SAM-dependent methyltransferase [Xenorhabdus budapestensis]
MLIAVRADGRLNYILNQLNPSPNREGTEDNMTQHKEKFDGLAKGYDRYRPRYPQALFREICHWLPKDRTLSYVYPANILSEH